MVKTEEQPGPDLWKLEKIILPFVDNSALWPVGAAVFGHVSVLAGIAMLYVVREGSPGAIVGILALSSLTAALIVREWRRRGRPAGMTVLLALTWIAAVLCAWGGDHIGAF